MWKLTESRRQFFAGCRRPEENFWKTLFEQAGRQSLIGHPKYADFLSWKPTHSNCPELENATRNLIEIAPMEWKATMRNIFVARAFKGEANAQASAFRSAGIIELNYGLTVAAMIYSTLFSQFYDAIRTTAMGVDWADEDVATTQMILEEIERSAFDPISAADDAVQTWAAERHVRATSPLHVELPPARQVADHSNLVLAVEEFVVGHEYCHHMLGHTDSSFRHARTIKQRVKQLLSEIESSSAMEELNDAQWQELEADIGALLLLSGSLSGKSERWQIYRAVGGSMLALVSLAHVMESWIDGGEQHPNFLVRYEVMCKAITKLTRGVPIGSRTDHPVGFLIQFRGFISAVLQTWASRVGEDIEAPKFLNIFSWMIDLQVEFTEDFEAGEVTA
ncbi:hypothetical protein ACPCSC_00765 [Streptomyces lavendulocolor]|uniref:hypothetical protein n=1 Tax=Streptomyces lavendulocolor TaxID=67316 RepID=UPI003C2FA692